MKRELLATIKLTTIKPGLSGRDRVTAIKPGLSGRDPAGIG